MRKRTTASTNTQTKTNTTHTHLPTQTHNTTTTREPQIIFSFSKLGGRARGEKGKGGSHAARSTQHKPTNQIGINQLIAKKKNRTEQGRNRTRKRVRKSAKSRTLSF